MKALKSKLIVIVILAGFIALSTSCSQKTGCPAKNFKIELFN